jgi:hypothetical protein
MDEKEKEIVIGSLTYKVSVLTGSHGGWLFVKCGNEHIHEQSGYKDYDKALSDGEAIAQADYLEKQTPTPRNPNSPWFKKQDTGKQNV